MEPKESPDGNSKAWPFPPGYGEILPDGTRICWPLHPNGRLPKPIVITLSRYDLFRGWLYKHDGAITWTLNITGLVLSLLALAISLLALAGCSRETPIDRPSPSVDAYTATDADLDRPAPLSPDVARNVGQSSAGKAVDEAFVAPSLRRQLDRPTTIATDTTQPLMRAPTHRVTFAGVAFSESAIVSVVQLSNQQCLTRYTMVPLSPSVTPAERIDLETKGRLQKDWRLPDHVRVDTVDETYCTPDFALIRIADAGPAVAFEVIRGAGGVHYSRMFFRASFRTQAPSVTLPVGLFYPRNNVERFGHVRIMVIGVDAKGSQVFMLPETRLADLPKWVEP